MPIVSCPKCPTKLRVPDGATGNVKCPKCNTVFPVAASAPAPAFEVLDDAPAKPAARPAASPPPPPKGEFEFDDDPKPRKKRVTAEVDDEDDDRPRKKRRDDDEDEDDRPRGRRRGRDDEDEDDRPRGRGRGRGRQRDDDDDDYSRPAGKKPSFGAGKVGMQLVGISLWLYVATFALLLLFLLLAWVGVSIPNGLMIVVGLLGLGNWIVGLIGLGFAIAGPAKARGLAIAATAVAAVHLILAFVIANNDKAAAYGFHAVEMLSAGNKAERALNISKKLQKETDPKRQKELVQELEDMSDGGRGFDIDRPGRGGDMRWGDLATLLPYSDQLIAVLAYQSKGFEYYILPLLGGLTEVARLILMILLIGAVGRAAKAYDAAERSPVATIVAGATTIAAILVILIIAVIMESSSKKVTSMEAAESLMKKGMNWMAIGALLVYACHLGGVILSPLMAMSASAGCRRRAR